MENWQLALVILGSLFVGALIPLLLMLAIALYRAGREFAEIGARLTRTMTQFETVSDRVEVLSRGFKGGETNIADLLTSVGNLARGLEHNLKLINILSAVMAAVAPAVAAFVKTRFPSEETGKPLAPETSVAPGNGPPPAAAAVSQPTTLEAH